MKRLRLHSVKDEREGEGGNQAGDKGAGIGRPRAFAHFVHFGFVVGIVAHFAGPGFGEQQRRIPEEAENHGGNCGNQDGKPIQAMHVHEGLLVSVCRERVGDMV